MTDFQLIDPKLNLITKTQQFDFNSLSKFSDDGEFAMGNFIAYRTWHTEVPDALLGRRTKVYKICFRHGSMSGKWILAINGVLSAQNEFKVNYDKIEYATPPDFEIKFKLDKIDFVLCVRHLKSSIKCQYSLIMENNKEPLPELRKDSSGTVGQFAQPSSFTINKYKKRKLEVSGSKDGSTKLMETKVFYEIEFELQSGAKIAVERRYSDFALLDVIVQAQTGAVLRQTLPTIPSKVYNPFTDQSSPQFIEQRMRALQQYLLDIIHNDKVFTYSEVLLFIGLDPSTGNPLPTTDTTATVFTVAS